MPRRPREFEVGNIYQILNRGVEKRKIFLKSQDYSRFILGLEFFNRDVPTSLWQYIARAGSDPARERLNEERTKKTDPFVELMAFTLMPNHYHFIIREIVDGGISEFMQKMGGYSIYFNKRYERVGPLFQSRYKAIPIRDDTQLKVVFAYVHTNPVELREPGWKDFTVKDVKESFHWLEEYRWSSLGDYSGRENFPEVTKRSFFLGLFSGEKNIQKWIRDWVSYKAREEKSTLAEFE